MRTRVPARRVGSVWRFVATLLLAGPLAAQYTIQTIAGGLLPSGVSATSVVLRPQSVAVDPQGNLYTSTGTVVYRVSAGTGLITPIAGNGRPGYSGDGGSPLAAQLNGALDVAADAAGNVYIADTGNHVVRKVTAAGVITTIAGTGTPGYSGDTGPATSAQLRGPAGVAIDSTGTKLYVSDTQNNVVRLISGSTITTIAGNGSGGFNGDGRAATGANLFQPQAVAVDAAGALYIADRLNHRIRKVTGGQISTIAGSGIPGYQGDGSLATLAHLNSPSGIALDATGALCLADSGNSVIRRVSAAGVITTLAGTVPGSSLDPGLATAAQLNSPQRVAVDASGACYLATL